MERSPTLGLSPKGLQACDAATARVAVAHLLEGSRMMEMTKEVI
jgi:hypothetical protein